MPEAVTVPVKCDDNGFNSFRGIACEGHTDKQTNNILGSSMLTSDGPVHRLESLQHDKQDTHLHTLDNERQHNGTIWNRDSNPLPLDAESSALTTGPRHLL